MYGSIRYPYRVPVYRGWRPEDKTETIYENGQWRSVTVDEYYDGTLLNGIPSGISVRAISINSWNTLQDIEIRVLRDRKIGITLSGGNVHKFLYRAICPTYGGTQWCTIDGVDESLLGKGRPLYAFILRLFKARTAEGPKVFAIEADYNPSINDETTRVLDTFVKIIAGFEVVT